MKGGPRGALAALSLALAVVTVSAGKPAASQATRGRLTLSGAWALYPLAIRWQDEFQKTHPGAHIDVQAGGAGKGVVDTLAGAVAVAVAKDAVVATVSRKNPFLDTILRRGLKREEFAAVWLRRTAGTWEGLLGLPGRTPVHVYTRSDACGAAVTWAAYMGGHQEDLAGIGVYGDPGLAEAVRRDHLGIGYNNVNFAYDARTLGPVSGLAVCPVDLDGSGAIEPGEAVYGTRDDIIRAIAAGIYPSPPARELYFVVKGQPRRPLLAEFLEWVLVEGQRYVAEMGYIAVGPDRTAAGLAIVRGAAERK
jgi:phosphate transport system substrate-binding protein